jgi:acyl-CoA synthetase (AMP-forming)/AMP-acid ligase II
MVTRVLQRLLNQGERHVGVLLPPSAGAVMANAALSLGRRVPVNLNYTLSTAALKSCIDQAGIRHVVKRVRRVRRPILEFHPQAERDLRGLVRP